MEKDKLSAVVDIILFGLPIGDGVISVQNNAYHIQNKRTKSVGLIEELQIKAGSNLGINNLIAKKLRDGIVNGIVEYLEKEKVVATVAEVVKEEEGIKAESEAVNDFAQSIADDLAETPTEPAVPKKKERNKLMKYRFA